MIQDLNQSLESNLEQVLGLDETENIHAKINSLNVFMNLVEQNKNLDSYFKQNGFERFCPVNGLRMQMIISRLMLKYTNLLVNKLNKKEQLYQV